MSIPVELAGGGDERVTPGNVLYMRKRVDFEKKEHPDVQSIILLGGVKLYCVAKVDDLAGQFATEIPLASLTAPNGAALYVHAKAVTDVDDAPPTSAASAKSWLVFGTGPKAVRQLVRETRAELREKWTALKLDPDDAGI